MRNCENCGGGVRVERPTGLCAECHAIWARTVNDDRLGIDAGRVSDARLAEIRERRSQRR